jgi:glycerophosphoryl diester phosphodiesterase
MRGVPIRIVGHRGAAALAPENTLAAFEAGVRAGVDEIEFDVQRTRDGVPIVIHDGTFERTTPLRGRVDETDHAAIRAGAPAVPSLDALCTWAASRAVGLMLELKQPGDGARDEGLVPAVLAILARHALNDRTVCISFDHPSLTQLHEFEPAARTGFLYGRTAPAAWPAWATGIHPHHRWITAELCARAHADGLYVHAWGFDPTPLEIARLVAAGADSLSADDPRTLVRALR